MRITRLDLLRYGKFTDKSVELPHADKDFHLIVGPNEAGKSTIRNAIQELLFGIETRSSYNFLHPHSALNLSISSEQGLKQAAEQNGATSSIAAAAEQMSANITHIAENAAQAHDTRC